MKNKTEVLLYLLQKEVEYLRSVLSEFDGDKSEYVQMMRANDLRRVIEDLECVNEK